MKRGALGTLRGWHLWLGVVLSLPILIVAITTIFLVHKDSIDAKRPLSLFSFLSRPSVPGMRLDMRAMTADASGGFWIGADQGVNRYAANGMTGVEGDIRYVRDLELMDDGSLLVASKSGLWRVPVHGGAELLESGEWRRLMRAGGQVFAANKRELRVSEDGGRQWQEAVANLPGDRSKLCCYLVSGQQVAWFAGENGLYRLDADGAPVRLLNAEIYDLQGLPDGVLAVGKRGGVWKVGHDDSVQQLGSVGEIRSLAGSPAGLYAASTREAWRMPVDGSESFQKVSLPADLTRHLGKSEESESKSRFGDGWRLDKIMKSLHTGKFLGSYDWLWGDIVGGSMILFTLTGLVMWWRGRGRRLQQAQAADR